MNIQTNNQKRGVTVWPEKLYTQHEVDGLLEKRDDRLSSQAREIEKRLKLRINEKGWRTQPLQVWLKNLTEF